MVQITDWEKVEVEDGDRIENEEMLKEKMKDERSMKEEEMENYLIMKNAEKSEEWILIYFDFKNENFSLFNFYYILYINTLLIIKTISNNYYSNHFKGYIFFH